MSVEESLARKVMEDARAAMGLDAQFYGIGNLVVPPKREPTSIDAGSLLQTAGTDSDVRLWYTKMTMLLFPVSKPCAFNLWF